MKMTKYLLAGSVLASLIATPVFAADTISTATNTGAVKPKVAVMSPCNQMAWKKYVDAELAARTAMKDAKAAAKTKRDAALKAGKDTFDAAIKAAGTDKAAITAAWKAWKAVKKDAVAAYKADIKAANVAYAAALKSAVDTLKADRVACKAAK